MTPRKVDSNQREIVKALTKDEITKSAIAELKANGGRIRKVHNVPFNKFKSRGQIEKGWSDIQGYSRTGVCILCEVKTIGDKLSQEQIERLEDLHKCGGISLVAIQKGTQVSIMKWEEVQLEALIQKHR